MRPLLQKLYLRFPRCTMSLAAQGLAVSAALDFPQAGSILNGICPHVYVGVRLRPLRTRSETFRLAPSNLL